jgi:hypothetical protein
MLQKESAIALITKEIANLKQALKKSEKLSMNLQT